MSLQNLKYILFFNSAALLRSIVGVIRSKIVAIWFGANGVGMLGQITTVYSTQSQLSDFGALAYLVNRVGKTDRERQPVVYLKIVFYSAGLIFIMNMVLVALGVHFRHELALLIFDSTDALLLVGLLLLVIPIYNTAYFFETLVRANKDYRRLAIGQNLAGIAGIITVVPLVLYFGITGIIYNLILFLVFYGCFFIVAGKRYWPKIEIKKLRVNREFLGALIFFCGSVMARKLLAFLSLLIFRILIVQYSSMSDNGYFQSVFSISNYITILLNGFIVYLFPALSGLFNEQELNKKLNQNLEYLLYFVYPAIALMILLPDIFLLMLYDSEFVAMAFPLILFSISKILEVAYYFYIITLLAQTRLSSLLIAESIKAALLVFGGWFFVQDFGLNGVFGSYLAAQIVGFLVMMLLVWREPGFRMSASNAKLLLWLTLSGLVFVIPYGDSLSLRVVMSGFSIAVALYVLEIRKYSRLLALFRKS